MLPLIVRSEKNCMEQTV